VRRPARKPQRRTDTEAVMGRAPVLTNSPSALGDSLGGSCDRSPCGKVRSSRLCSKTRGGRPSGYGYRCSGQLLGDPVRGPDLSVASGASRRRRRHAPAHANRECLPERGASAEAVIPGEVLAVLGRARFWSFVLEAPSRSQNPPGATPCEFDSRLGHLLQRNNRGLQTSG